MCKNKIIQRDGENVILVPRWGLPISRDKIQTNLVTACLIVNKGKYVCESILRANEQVQGNNQSL